VAGVGLRLFLHAHYVHGRRAGWMQQWGGTAVVTWCVLWLGVWHGVWDLAKLWLLLLVSVNGFFVAWFGALAFLRLDSQRGFVHEDAQRRDSDSDDDMLRTGQIQIIGPGYDGGHLMRIGVPGDGNCLLHSILHAISAEYRASADRGLLAKNFRKELRFNVRRLIEVAFEVNSFCRDKATADPTYRPRVLQEVGEVIRASMSPYNQYHAGAGDPYDNRVFYKCGTTKIHKDCAILVVLKALQFPMMNEFADLIQGEEIPIEMGPVIAKALPFFTTSVPPVMI
jgi:hypothetical protein